MGGPQEVPSPDSQGLVTRNRQLWEKKTSRTEQGHFPDLVQDLPTSSPGKTFRASSSSDSLLSSSSPAASLSSSGVAEEDSTEDSGAQGRSSNLTRQTRVKGRRGEQGEED